MHLFIGWQALEAELLEDEKRSKLNIAKKFEANAKSELQVNHLVLIDGIALIINIL